MITNLYVNTSKWAGILFLGLISLNHELFAQMPVCGDGTLYMTQSSGPNTVAIFNFNTALPMSATNPILNTIPIPLNAHGLTIGKNINAAAPSPTFYTTVNGYYHYYDGSSWVNTFDRSGPYGVASIAAGGGYIYNLDVTQGGVYRYNATGDAKLLVTLPGATLAWGVAPGLAADCQGNFYILNLAPYTAALEKYDSSGAFVKRWSIYGSPPAAWSGFGIVGNHIYYQAPFTWDIWEGTINANDVTFTSHAPSSRYYGNMTGCTLGGDSTTVSIDTVYYCGGVPGVPVSANGTGPFTWSVLSGPAVVNGAGANVTVTATAASRILLSSSAFTICGTRTDTIDIIVPTAQVDAGPLVDSIYGCGSYRDTLHGTLSNLTPGILYDINWSPSANIVTGGNTLNPIITPSGNTSYVLQVSTPATQGGCIWKDTVHVVTVNNDITAGYSFDIHYGCTEDTVVFMNNALPGTSSFWDFGDNITSNTPNPIHIYHTQQEYKPLLIVSNGYCTDTVVHTVDIRHSLSAQFLADSVCLGDELMLLNTSAAKTKNNIKPSYLWDFGDGNYETSYAPVHTYQSAGTYNIMLVVKDFVPCYDTAYNTVIVDSTPYVRIIASDSPICINKEVYFSADYLQRGNTGIQWSLDDGTKLETRSVAQTFYSDGVYMVMLTAYYRICPTISISYPIDVVYRPPLYLGADVTMCNGDSVWLSSNYANTIWSTGDTGSMIVVNKGGLYTGKATDSCGVTYTDEVKVSAIICPEKYCNVLEFPSAFTPNGDGKNDLFKAVKKGEVFSYSLKIYTRWGTEVYSTINIGDGWNGTFNGIAQNAGVYMYLCQVTCPSGDRIMKGDVTLIR